MAITNFPSVEFADDNGLLAIGGDLEFSTLKLAYSQGIFPWPYSDTHPLAWYSPDPRGVLDFSDLHISRSMSKELRKNDFRLQFNSHFAAVINHCAQARNRKGQKGTWITGKMIEAYIKLHQKGYAFSAEVFMGEKLVGGIYGVCLGQMISGESMFYLQTGASKFAVIALMEHLHRFGINWIDTQMVTPVIMQMGGKEIPRHEFLVRHGLAIKKERPKGLFSQI